MKLIIFLVSLFFTVATPKLSEVRVLYTNAGENETLTKQLHQELEGVKESDTPALVAYKGAVMTMMAKYTRKKGEKLDFFKGGVALIEAAILSDPSNIEIRTIRLSIQENAPKFLRYHKNKEEDKQLIVANFPKIQNKEIRTVIRSFVLQSSEFSEAEKARF